MSAPGIRARVRAEMIDEIKAVATRHLQTDGSNLSLRAVARDLGMVSSAVYRYFASRDDLLTALIIDAYNDLGDAVDAAEDKVDRGDFRGRWIAVGTATRAWAVSHPAEYALLFGSPVPGYHAPAETNEPGIRTIRTYLGILVDAAAASSLRPTPGERLPRPTREAMAFIRADLAPSLAEPVIFRAVTVWATLYGSISFELWGRYGADLPEQGSILDHQLTELADYLGLR
jgi:AcrR family transcriptional regulator